MAQENAMTVQVPTQLAILGNLAQSIVTQLQASTNWMSVVSGAFPTLFQEGAQWSELQAEVKDPQAIVLASIVIGQVVAALVAAKVAAPAAAPAVAPAPAV